MSIQELRGPESPSAGVDVRPQVLRALSHWRRILAITLAAAVLGYGIGLLMPRWYRATALILPPDETDLLSNLSFASRALSKFPVFGELGEYFTPADIYKAVLKSRTVQEYIADRYDLSTVYRKKSREKTLKEFSKHAAIKLNPDGTIQVAVEDRDPRRAAEMTNAMLVALDEYNILKRNTQARRSRLFLERRLAETDSLLRASETALRRYQEVHHAVAPTSINSADMTAATDVMARKLMLEVRLGVLRGYLREDDEQVVQTRSELDQLKRGISTLPTLQSELTRLMRDHKVQEQLYILLTAELEQARIQEAKDTPTVQVLDAAIPPERHQRPRRSLIAAGAAALGLLGALAYFSLRDESARA